MGNEGADPKGTPEQEAQACFARAHALSDSCILSLVSFTRDLLRRPGVWRSQRRPGPASLEQEEGAKPAIPQTVIRPVGRPKAPPHIPARHTRSRGFGPPWGAGLASMLRGRDPSEKGRVDVHSGSTQVLSFVTATQRCMWQSRTLQVPLHWPGTHRHLPPTHSRAPAQSHTLTLTLVHILSSTPTPAGLRRPSGVSPHWSPCD